MGALASYGTGRYVAGEADVLWLPRTYKRDGSKMGVIYVHGAGELAGSPMGSVASKTNEAFLLRQIATKYPLAIGDLGVWAQGGASDSNSWGNTNAQTRLGQLKAWLQNASGGGARSGKVALVGLSMGTLTSLNYARNNPTEVAGVMAGIPVVDLDDVRDNDLGGGPDTGYTTVLGQASSTTTGTTLPIPVGSGATTLLQGDCIVVAVVTDGTSTAPSVADSKGNTWQTDQNVTGGTNAGHIRLTVFSCVLAAGKVLVPGDTITVTHGSVVARSGVAVALRGNPTTGWKDTSAGVAASGTKNPSVATAAFAGPIVLAVGVVGYENRGIAVTHPSGWTPVVQEEVASGSVTASVGLAMAVQRFPTSQAVTYSATIPASDNCIICVNYKKTSGYRASIGNAWATTYPTALPAGANPSSNLATHNSQGIPIKLWYANDDAIARADRIANFVAGVASASATDLGATGHSDTTIGAIPYGEVFSLLAAWESL